MYYQDLLHVQVLASKFYWVQVSMDVKSKSVIFKKGDSAVAVSYAGTRLYKVSTVLNHPIAGRRLLTRDQISLVELEKIFQNPRVHTGKGYFVRAINNNKKS